MLAQVPPGISQLKVPGQQKMLEIHLVPTNNSTLLFCHDSPDNFAKLFRPKASLFNKVLELTIDDLHYISFPCPCSDELSTDTSVQTTTDVITLFNVVIATVRESAMKKLEATSGSNSNLSFSKFESAGSDPVAITLGLQSANQAVSPNVLRR